MPIEQYTYWSITINNPTEADYLIARNPNEKYVRQFVWTPEEGETTGTPHIQGWLRCQRNMTRTAVQKLYPRSHLKPCDKDEYNERVHQYAQKDDPTTRGPHMITINDPLPSVERMLPEIYQFSFDNWVAEHTGRQKLDLVTNLGNFSYQDIRKWRPTAESSLVRERGPLYAKVFVSPVYEKLIKKFGEELFLHWRHNQITHAQEDSLSRSDAGGQAGGEGSQGDEDSQTQETERSGESGSVSSCSQDDESECGEQDDW